ncbi:MAG: lysophospholipid acyltransferase family protein [Desulfobacula sp.]|nr:lysophospholipid acyltransferase family protein [Desulfobacula sp.]
MTNNDGSNWTSKSLGSKSGHHFFYLMVRLGGRRPAYFFLYFIVLYYVVFVPSVKEKTDPYLSKRFPDSGLIKRIVDRYLWVLHLGKALIDRAIFGICGKESIHISFDNSNDLKKIKSLNAGFIIVMSHVGCWQVTMSALSALGRPVNLLMLQDDHDIDKHYFEHGKQDQFFNIISPEQFLGGTIEMLNVLKNDEVLCIMGDRVFKNNEFCIDTHFLGSDVLFPLSAYKIASIAQKPIVVLYSQKTGPKSYTLTIPQIIHVPVKLGRKQENYRPYADKFVRSLEQYTKEYPYQFFNFYDMWKDNK